MDDENRTGRRRGLLRGGALVAFGAGLGVVGLGEGARIVDRGPLRDGSVSAAPQPAGQLGPGTLAVSWCVETSRKVVALTFDDGPGPRWTPMVLDVLEEHRVPATFFMVGRNVRRHRGLVRDRLAGHDVGSHSWAHQDLARLDARAAYEDLGRTHQELGDLTGREPILFRPPYGHLGGAVLAAAVRLRYRLVLWSHQMRESEFPGDPAGHARWVVTGLRPGAVLLAHDVGDERRLVALRGLADVIGGLRSRGFEFVTVSQLLAGGH